MADAADAPAAANDAPAAAADAPEPVADSEAPAPAPETATDDATPTTEPAAASEESATASAATSAASMPPGWRAVVAEDRRVYYYNEQTGETSWTLPDATEAASAPAACSWRSALGLATSGSASKSS